MCGCPLKHRVSANKIKLGALTLANLRSSAGSAWAMEGRGTVCADTEALELRPFCD